MLDKNTSKSPKKKKPPRPPKIARDFLTPGAALEQRSPAGPLMWLFGALIALVISALAWSMLARIDVIVMARGQLVTTSPTLVVQPLETVMIKNVYVKVGDIVKEGQVLASLDPTFVDADVEQLRGKRDALMAREQRLEAELSNGTFTVPDAPSQSEKLEKDIFDSRAALFAARIGAYEQDLAQSRAALDSARKERVAIAGSIQLLEEIVQMRQGLVDKELARQTDLISAQITLVESQREALQIDGQISQYGHRIESLGAQRATFERQWHADIADQLAQVRRERADAAEELNKAVRRLSMVNLAAPADGVVLELANRSVGSVLQQAEPFVTLVPLDAPLEVDVRVAAADVGRLRTGEDVRIKLDAFPFQQYGTAKGQLTSISADAFVPGSDPGAGQNGAGVVAAAPYYKARISLDETGLTGLPDGAALLPGMSATAEIKIGNRRVIDYILYPILKGLDESIREP